VLGGAIISPSPVREQLSSCGDDYIRMGLLKSFVQKPLAYMWKVI
jgi:hypothetical protein